MGVERYCDPSSRFLSFPKLNARHLNFIGKRTIFLTERCPSFGATYYILFSLTFFASQTFSVQHKKTPNPCGELLKSDRYVTGKVAENDK